MNRDDPKKYPRTIESRNSYLRIRAPEHLDVALEGLIRKVLKEQPKMDDIYAFAADYFDMLLKIREKAGIRKLSVQDICPYHNEEDAHEMIKLASTFTSRAKRVKPQPRTYKALTLLPGDQGKLRKYGERTREKDRSARRNEDPGRIGATLPMVMENPEKEEPRREDVRDGPKVEKSERSLDDTEFDDYAVRVPSQAPSEVIIQAREVINEDAEDEEEAVPEQEEDTSPEGMPEVVGDIDEIRDKIRTVEDEIKQLEQKRGGTETGETVNAVTNENEMDEKAEEMEGNEDGAGGVVTSESGKEESEERKSDTDVLENKEAETDVATDIQETQTTESNAESVAEAGESKTGDEEEQEASVEGESDVADTQETESKAGNAVDDAQTAEDPNTKPEETAEEATEEGRETADVTTEGTEPETQTTADEAEDEVMGGGAEEMEEAQRKTETAEDGGEEANGEDAAEETEETSTAESAVVEEQQHDQMTAKERELIGGNNLRDEMLENDAFLTEERHQGEVTRSEPAPPGDASQGVEGSEDQPETEETATADDKVSQDVEKEESEGSLLPAGEQKTEDGDNEVPAETNSGGDASAILGAGTVGAAAAALAHAGYELSKTSEEAPTEESIKVVEETQPSPSAEEILMAGGTALETTPAEEVQKFLDTERQHSSYDREPITEDAEVGAQDDGNGKVNESAPMAETNENDEISARIVPDSLASASVDQEGPRDETPMPGDKTPEKIESEKVDTETERAHNDNIDVEASDGGDQDRDGSTTSDEIEFDTYQTKSGGATNDTDKAPEQVPEALPVDEDNPAIQKEEELDDASEKGAGTGGKETHPDYVTETPTRKPQSDESAEPAIELTINEVESEDRNDENTEGAMEPSKGFLEVPGPVLDEYPSRKTGDNVEGSEIGDEANQSGRTKRSTDTEERVEEDAEKTEAPGGVEEILDCGNVGNEIIQTGEVQKVELIEGDEDILQVHLTTTIQTESENGDSIQMEMTSRIDPKFEVSVETRVESPVQGGGGVGGEKMSKVRAAVIIQNLFRRFKNRQISGEPRHNQQVPDLTAQYLFTGNETATESALSVQSVQGTSSRDSDSSLSSSATKINNKDFKGRNFSRSNTRTLLETQSLDPIRKITPLKTRSLSTVRYGVADFEVWNQLVQELEEAATKIQSNYRCYRTRKKLRRENAIQSTTTTSEDSTSAVDISKPVQRHTGEFHDSIVLPPDPK